MDSLTVSYVGEQWRLGQADRGPDRLDFQYSTNATSLTDGTWTDFDALDFLTPNTGVTAGASDGNTPTFRASISATITGVNFGPQMTLFIRWVDADIAGPEDGLAIDDFSFTPGATVSFNDPPVNSVPPAQTVLSNSATPINGFSIADPNAGDSPMTTKLSVLHGTLRFAMTGGAMIDGNGSSQLTLHGSLSEINAALTAPDNLTYQSHFGFSGADTLTITTTDTGVLDRDEAQSDTDQVAITVAPPLTGTSGNDSFAAPPGSVHIDGLGGIDTVTFDFRLIDARVSYADNTVVIDGPLEPHRAERVRALRVHRRHGRQQ